MSSDIKAVRVTTTGAAFAGPARLVGYSATSDGVGAGRITITDGSGGATLMDLDIANGATVAQSQDLAGCGIKGSTGLWVSAITNVVGLTLFYTG